MNRVMIDLETLNIDDDALIISIGAVVFNPQEIGPEVGSGLGAEFYTPVAQQLQREKWRRTIGLDTLKWWDQQSEAAKQVLADSGNYGHAPLLPVALHEFSRFFASSGATEIWAKPSGFDVTILKRAYGAVGSPTPWNWHDVRDLSTIRALGYPRDTAIEARAGTAHNALDDARVQAMYAIKWIRRIARAERVLCELEKTA